MKILVYGAGSLGSILGGMLAKEHLVALLGRKEHVEAVRKSGLKIEGLIEETVEMQAITTLYELDWEPDLVLLTVKSYDTHTACQDLLCLEPVPVIGFQNGLGNLETMQNILWDRECAYAATTSMGAYKVAPGIVRYTGEGITRIPPAHGDDEISFTMLAETLAREGLNLEEMGDVNIALWQKAAVNLGINYLTALSGKDNGVLADNWEDAEAFIRKLLEEMIAIANAEEIRLDVESCLNSVLTVASNTSANRSSMLQDMDKGRKTENPALAGYLLEKGNTHGLSSPRIEGLHMLVKLAERGNG